MAQKFTFSLDHNFAAGALQLDPSSSPVLLAALTATGKLPAGDNLIAGGDLSVAPGQDITVGPAKVSFSADANAAIGVYSTPGNLRAEILLKAGLVSQISDAITLPQADRLLLLRWNYDLSATASGTVALGPAANVNFSASGETKGYFAIVQGVSADADAVGSLTNLIKSWKLPSQVDDISKLPVATVMIAEIDGSFSFGAAATFGYEFNWIRTIKKGLLGGDLLKGDIGLKLKAGLTATLGIGMTGKYAIMLSRDTDLKIRMRLYKLAVKELDLGLDASLNVKADVAAPDSLDDLVKAVTGTHQQQIMKLLGQVEDWTNPSTPIFGPFVKMADGEAQKLISQLTGVADLSAGFDTAKARIQNLFNFWDKLPQTATQFLWSKLPDPQAIKDVASIAKQVGSLSAPDLLNLIQTKLPDVAFMNTDTGKALESFAAIGLFSAIQDTKALTDIQHVAGVVANILDGSQLQQLLTNLQSAVNSKLDLKNLKAVVDQSSFDSLDSWLKARLEDFLEKDLVGAQGLKDVTALRAGLQTILTKAGDFYKKALAAVRENYSFTFSGTYQATAANSALLDVVFDFGAANSQAGQGLKMALSGNFDQLLQSSFPGVTVNSGMLAFGLHKETHVSIVLPHFATNSVDVNQSVAQLKVVSADEGGLVFGLDSSDTFTVKNDFSSALTIGLSAPGKQNQVNVHAPTATYRYVLKVGLGTLTNISLSQVFAPVAQTYFADRFKQNPPGSFSDWANLIAPPDGDFGNSLVALSVSLPSSAAAAWTKAPDNKADPAYKRMSIALQRQFKRVLHDTFFSAVSNYNATSTNSVAFAMLAFCSIPPCSNAVLIDGGEHVKFLNETATGNTINWDYNDRAVSTSGVDLRAKVLFAPETVANLRQLLQIARQRLKDAGDPKHKLGFYADDPIQIRQILNTALQGTQLDHLFPVEGNLVQQAMTAGTDMAAFRANQFKDPVAAREKLARFGQKLSSDFNSNLKGIIGVGDALMPLGTAIYAAGARALDSTIDTDPAAMFTVETLNAGVTSLDPAPSDILHTARVVHLRS